jgi:hypothetical protein
MITSKFQNLNLYTCIYSLNSCFLHTFFELRNTIVGRYFKVGFRFTKFQLTTQLMCGNASMNYWRSQLVKNRSHLLFVRPSNFGSAILFNTTWTLGFVDKLSIVFSIIHQNIFNIIENNARMLKFEPVKTDSNKYLHFIEPPVI